MGLIYDALQKWMNRYWEKNEDRILYAMQKVNEGGDVEDIDTIVTDYFYLVKAVHRKKPKFVDIQGLFTLIIDGEPYDLHVLIRHNDSKNTERIMEIEVLLSDRTPLDEIQKRLNEKIDTQW